MYKYAPARQPKINLCMLLFVSKYSDLQCGLKYIYSSQLREFDLIAFAESSWKATLPCLR